MSDSVQPQRRQPTRLPRPWDSPGKNTGVGCHFLLQCMKVKSESEVAQSCLTFSDPMDCSPPGSMGFSRQEYWSGVPLSSPKQQPKPPRTPPPQKPCPRAWLQPEIPSCLSLWSPSLPPPCLGKQADLVQQSSSSCSRRLCPSGFPGPWEGSAHRSLASSPPHMTRIGEGSSAPVAGQVRPHQHLAASSHPGP